MSNHKQSPIAMGFHAVQSILENDPSQIASVMLSESRRDKRMQALHDKLVAASVSVSWQPKAVLDQCSEGERHQGVVAWLHGNSGVVTLDDLLSADAPFLLCLDQVQDPHNLGACLRLSAAFGVTGIVIPKHGSVGLTATVRKVASGADQLVPVVEVTNLNRAIEAMQEKGVWVYGLAESGDTALESLSGEGAIAVVMGAEGRGLRANVAKHCDGLVSIETHSRFSTLNVATAAAIALHTLRRDC